MSFNFRQEFRYLSWERYRKKEWPLIQNSIQRDIFLFGQDINKQPDGNDFAYFLASTLNQGYVKWYLRF